MSLAVGGPDREYFTDRPDPLGEYMRCASKALDDDPSIGQRIALERIAADCRPFRDDAIKIFVPLYQKRMNAKAPIIEADTAERTILGIVLAEQMRRETESVESATDGDAVNLAIEPYRKCMGSYLAGRVPETFDLLKTYVLAREALKACSEDRVQAADSAELILVSRGMTDAQAIRRLVSRTLCEVDYAWGWRPEPAKDANSRDDEIPVVAMPSNAASVCTNLAMR